MPDADVPVQLISDPGDTRIADYRALTDVELRTRWEPPHGVFIAEGELVLRRALRAGYAPRSYLIDVKRLDQLADLASAAGAAPVYAAGQEVLRHATGFHVHRGVLASFHRRPLPSAEQVLSGAQCIAICEDVNNHTNLGAIFRGAAGLGMDGMLLSPSCADPLYRRSVRVSMGEVFAVPYATLAPWPDALALVRAAGFSLLALTPAAQGPGSGSQAPLPGSRSGSATPPDVVPLQRLAEAHRRRPAVLLGAEGSGLSAAAVAAADQRVAIPMRRGVDSLNVAAAAAVAFWELAGRQA